MDIFVVLTLLTILMCSFYIASFLMIMNLKRWVSKRDLYYEQKLQYNEDVTKILIEVKQILNQINKQYGTRNESMDETNI